MNDKNYKTTSQSKVLTVSGIVRPDGYGSIELVNIGTDTAYINDNIPLAAGSIWSWTNHPNVTIDENTTVRFAGAVADKQVLVQMYYFKEC